METKKIEPISSEYFDCECSISEHTLRFVYIPSFRDKAGKVIDGPELHTEIYLNQYRNIFQRIWVAIKYVCGYKCRYGHWDTWQLRSKDCERLRDLVSKMIVANNKSNKKTQVAK